MPEPVAQLTEEEITDAVADALTEQGFAAFSQDTGGDIACVVLEHKGGGEIIWGTADETWGAIINDADGEYVSAIETDCPSSSQDVSTITDTLKRASIAAGALFTPAV